MPTSRQELIALQKKLVEELKETIYEHVGRNDPVLDRYYRDYQQEFKRGFERPASRGEIVLSLARSHVAFFGDYHTLRSSQTAVLELLDEARANHGKRSVLAVEMLRAADNHVAAAFIAGRFDGPEFRKRVRWTRSWNFPWASWGRFFEFARKHDAPLFGVNIDADARADGLQWRDDFAADLVAALTQLHPDKLIAVVYGDLHMARGHLPAAVHKRLERFGVHRRMLRLYQNSETVHWSLVEKRLESVVDYVKLGQDVYCLMNATPLVKFQSFLNWQHRAGELVIEGPAADAEYADEMALEQVRGFIRSICAFLDITLPDPDNFELYTASDLDFFSDLAARNLYKPEELEALKEYVAMADSAFFERARIIYIGNFSVADAAEAGARFILAELRPKAANPAAPVDARDEFYGRCMVEALAFFCSKVIDHRRIARDGAAWRELRKRFGKRKRLGAVQKRDLATATEYLRHKGYEARVLKSGDYGRPPAGLYGLPRMLHVSLTRALGRSLGAMLYDAVTAERIGRPLVVEAMKDDVRKPDQCRSRYFQVLRMCVGSPPSGEEE